MANDTAQATPTQASVATIPGPVEHRPVSHGVTFTDEQLRIIRDICAPGCSDDEFVIFLHHCGRTGLDPLSKQIYGIMRWNSREKRKVLTIMTSIDGYRVIASRTQQHAGTDDAIFTIDASGRPTVASVTVYRVVRGVRCPFTASARWEEYVPEDDNGKPAGLWGKMPKLMLSKCAESLALRKAFPEALSGVYTEDEMAQAENAPVEKKPVPPAKAPAMKQVTIEQAVTAAATGQLPAPTKGSPASMAQKDRIEKFLDFAMTEKWLPLKEIESLRPKVKGLTSAQASQWITKLNKLRAGEHVAQP